MGGDEALRRGGTGVQCVAMKIAAIFVFLALPAAAEEMNLVAGQGEDAGSLIRMDGEGKVLWRAALGAKHYWPDEAMNVAHWAVGDLDGDGQAEIAVALNHKQWFPSRLVILSQDGAVLSEFWNPGHNSALVIGDLDGAAPAELIAGFVNNDLGHPCVACFSGKVEGEGPSRASGEGHGSAAWYVAIEEAEGGVERLEVRDGGVLAVAGGTEYRIDRAGVLSLPEAKSGVERFGDEGFCVVVSATAPRPIQDLARRLATDRKGVLVSTSKRSVDEIDAEIEAAYAEGRFDRILLFGSPARIPHLVVTYGGEPCFTDVPYEDIDDDGLPDVASSRLYDTWDAAKLALALEAGPLRPADGLALEIGGGGTDVGGRFHDIAARLGFARFEHVGTTPDTMERIRAASFVEASGGHSSALDIDLGGGTNKFLVKDLPALDGKPFFMMPICSPADARHRGNWPETLFDRGAVGFLGASGVTMAWHGHSPACFFYFDRLCPLLTKGTPIAQTLLEAKRAHIAAFPRMKERIAFSYRDDCEPKHYVEDPDTYTVLEFLFFGDPDLRF